MLDHAADTVRAFRCRHFATPWSPPAGTDTLRETDGRLRDRLRARRSGPQGRAVDEALCIPIDRLLTALDDLLAESASADTNR
ncbi:hypothetical protein GCM10023195_36580 [Actinoallomurus liliacearum]|uniref:Uncharacterized protein n=1 Tax=Actinoallomurus liliacearum TaxID=1080073 RepID=A0ABP8TLY1_9ACTN